MEEEETSGQIDDLMSFAEMAEALLDWDDDAFFALCNAIDGELPYRTGRALEH